MEMIENKEDEKGNPVPWKSGEKSDYLDVINYAVMLDGMDVFMLKVAVDLKIQQLEFDRDALDKKIMKEMSESMVAKREEMKSSSDLTGEHEILQTPNEILKDLKEKEIKEYEKKKRLIMYLKYLAFWT